MTSTKPTSTPNLLIRRSVLIAIALFAGLCIVQWSQMNLGTLQSAMRGTGVTVLGMTLLGSLICRFGSESKPESSSAWTVSSSILGVAFFLAVVVVVIQTTVIITRGVFVTLDLVQGYPSSRNAWIGYGLDGLWSIIALCGASFVAIIVLRDRRQLTCLFWIAILLTLWGSLLPLAYRELASGGFERSGNTLLILASWSVVSLAVFLLAKLVPDTTSAPEASSHQPPPGFPISLTLLAAATSIVTCYHLAVPIRLPSGGYLASSLIVTASTASLGLTCFAVLRSAWNPALADASMGLLTLSACALATLAVPQSQDVLVLRFPMLFNAMIFGFALSSAVWAHMACTCRSAAPDAICLGLPANRAAPYARRASYVAAALALVCCTVMALWPRFPGIATMDDSIGRMTSGLAANLFLLLIMLWSSRRLQSSAYHILTVATVLSTATFIGNRVSPFTSSIQ